MPAKPKPRTLAPKPCRPCRAAACGGARSDRHGREAVARTVNAGLTLLYWEIGTRTRTDVLKEKRADYGKEILHTLSAQLEAEFGRKKIPGINGTRLRPVIAEDECHAAAIAPEKGGLWKRVGQ